MTCNPCAGMSGEQLLNAFIIAPQQLANEITVEMLSYPSYWIGLAPVLEFPNFSGTELQRYTFSFAHTNPYYGLEGWRPVEASFGRHDACALPPAETIGWSMERKSFGLMERRLNTPEFCVRDIQTSYQGDQIFSNIIKMLAVTSAIERERLSRNAYFIRSQKYVALQGWPQNTANPYDFPLIPAAQELSVLTYHQLLYFYNFLTKRYPDHVIGMADGRPLLGICCSDETWHNMLAEDDQLYQAVIRSPMVGEFLTKYNFMERIGPFVHMPDSEVERFERDSDGKFLPVSPTVRVPVETGFNPSGPNAFGSGVKTVPNPNYEFAKYEAVKVILKDAFALRVRPQVTDLGGEGTFGPEPSMFEWMLAQPERCADIYKRKLWYESYAEVGIDWGDAEPVTIMVRRDLNVRLFKAPAFIDCITGEDCDLTIPAQGCPCPKVVCVVKTEFDDTLLFTFDSPLGLVATDSIDIVTNDGGFDTGTVMAVNGNDVKVEFSVSVTPLNGHWLEYKCATIVLPCHTAVRYDCPCPSGVDNAMDVAVVNNIRCNQDNDVITAMFGDGSTMPMVLQADAVGNVYTLKFQNSELIAEREVCLRRGIKSLCCVPTDGNGCPVCGPVYTVCDPEAAPPAPGCTPVDDDPPS